MNSTDFISGFEQTLESMLDLVKRKNVDYGSKETDAFANFRNVEKLGICSVEQGLLTRISDKISRATTLISANDRKVEDEKVTDTLQDLANYAVILKLYVLSKN